MKSIYELELHEQKWIDNYTVVRRVPGGWVYIETHEDYEHRPNATNTTVVFVSYDNEFQLNELEHKRVGFSSRPENKETEK